jgi:CHAT domain-containing protein
VSCSTARKVPRSESRRAFRHALCSFVLDLLILVMLTNSQLASLAFPDILSSTNVKPAGSPPGSESNPPLEAGKWLEGEISSGQDKKYRIKAGTSQYFSLEIERWGADLSGILSDSNGNVVREFNCSRDEITTVSVISESTGAYALSLSTAGNIPIAARFELRLREIRQSKETDHQRIIEEKILAEAEQLRRSRKIASYLQALEKYREVLSLAQAISDRFTEANALKNLGKSYQALNQSDEALKHYGKAIEAGRKTNDLRLQADIANCRAFFYSSIGSSHQALADASAALERSERAHARGEAARARYTSGEAYYGLGKVQRGLEESNRALALQRELNDPQGQALSLVAIGYAYSSLSDTSKAREAYFEALKLSTQAQDQLVEARSLRALGLFHVRLGEYQKALDFFLQGLRRFELIDDQLTQGTVLAGIGFTYENLGERKKALDYYNDAIAIFQEIKNPWAEAETRMDAGRVSHSLGENTQALTNYRLALDLFRALRMTRLEAQTLRDIGRVYDSSGNRSQALSFYNQSLSFRRAGQDQRSLAYTLDYVGVVYEKAGDARRAMNYYGKALKLNRQADDPAGEALTLFLIAHAQRDLGDLIAARSQIETCLKISESLRIKVSSRDVRASFVASTHRYYELHADILMQMHRTEPGKGFAEAAFEADEKARARSLLESLQTARAEIRLGADASLLERENSLANMLNTKTERHAQLVADKNNDEAQQVAKEIDQLTNEYDLVRGLIRSQSPHYAALTQPQPLSLRDVQQQLLNNNTLLLEYTLGEDRSYLWAITKTELLSFELPAQSQIEEAVERFRQLLLANLPVAGDTPEQRQARIAEANEHFPAEAAALGKLVLGPIADKLGDKRLIVVPDGALQYIPFQALAVSGAQTDPVPLLLNHEIVYEPSASALALVISEAAQRKQAPNSVAVFANPVFESDDPRVKSTGPSETKLAQGQSEQSPQSQVQEAFRDIGFGDGSRIPPLPASRDEANAIMAVTPWRTGFKAEGFEASRATIMRPAMNQYRIVHFATHGFVDYQHPDLSGLVLSLVDENGRAQDGFLRMHDIYNLKLPVDLVVLSACNTGLGKEVKGEGLIALTRGFMYAGAGGVVASLWKVDDDATAALMTHFYEGMFKRQLTPAAALREAQLRMSREKRWQSPYYWAAFVLQGQYNQKEMLNPRLGVWQIAALAALISIFPAIIFLFLRRRRRKIRQTQDVKYSEKLSC